MNTKQLTDLIQQELDGVLSPQEELRLREMVAKDAAAAELRRNLVAVSRTLATVDRKEVPPSLKPSIMRALEARASVPQQRGASLSVPIASFFRSLSPRGAFAGGLVAGLVLALIAFVALVPFPLEETDLVGTMRLTESVPVMTPIARVPVMAEGLAGSLTLESSGKFQMATVVLSTGDAEHSAILSYPADEVRLAAVRPEGAGSVPVTAGGGRIELEHQSQTTLELFFDVRQDASAPLRLIVRTADGVEHETEIAFAPPAPH
ncbi:MAG: hypothetical protein AMS21_04820 [Gemmatimonas sp. SG8_38_2]|nr:MAG: hypothetical protein AMS21_04820 [Gemmatimonas sp. SG8_38_2]